TGFRIAALIEIDSDERVVFCEAEPDSIESTTSMRRQCLVERAPGFRVCLAAIPTRPHVERRLIPFRTVLIPIPDNPLLALAQGWRDVLRNHRHRRRLFRGLRNVGFAHRCCPPRRRSGQPSLIHFSTTAELNRRSA